MGNKSNNKKFSSNKRRRKEQQKHCQNVKRKRLTEENPDARSSDMDVDTINASSSETNLAQLQNVEPIRQIQAGTLETKADQNIIFTHTQSKKKLTSDLDQELRITSDHSRQQFTEETKADQNIVVAHMQSKKRLTSDLDEELRITSELFRQQFMEEKQAEVNTDVSQGSPNQWILDALEKSLSTSTDAENQDSNNSVHSENNIDENTETLPSESDYPDLQVEVEAEPSKYKESIYVGRRIVNISSFFENLKQISSHGPLGCGLQCVDLIGEKLNALQSKFTFLCRMCNKKFVINSDNSEENFLKINECAVAGTVSIGAGHSQLQEFSAALNLPITSSKTYQGIHDTLSTEWKELAQETMDAAAEEERAIAISKGRVNKDGIPIIDVIADGCYSKRTYKKNYSSLSGAAAILGRETRQILYLNVKNKYCYTCDRAEKKKIPVKGHVCYKNYTGPSTGMESDILVEGFKKSVETHNLIYGRLVSDGDASTFSKIRNARPYHKEEVSVEKIECRNHLLRNFVNKLEALKTDTRFSLKDRKLHNKTKIMIMRVVITDAIKKNKNAECPEIQNMLYEDINRAHLHAFGDHSRCKSYFCTKVGQQEDTPNDFFQSPLWLRISIYVQNMAGHANSLIHDVDSNIVERYHSIVAKCIGGKRINFSLKQSYATRCTAAAVSFNTKKTISRLYKKINMQSPRGKLKLLEERRIKKKALNLKYKYKKRRIQYPKNNANYGEHCIKEDMPPEALESAKKEFLRTLQKTDDDRKRIEKNTLLQRNSSTWMELRRTLLTASNFSRVIKRRPNTPTAPIVKQIIYQKSLDQVPSIQHGIINEKTALAQLALQENIEILPCGLFIDKDHQFLGASPDGLCGTDTIIEVKCPITAAKLGIQEAIKQRKVNFWLAKGSFDEINKNHAWYYQIQGQLHITGRKRCIFGAWTNETQPLKTAVIEKDDDFWSMNMEEKLVKFYKDCLLPEIIDPRVSRNMPIREPNYITLNTKNTKTKNTSQTS